VCVCVYIYIYIYIYIHTHTHTHMYIHCIISEDTSILNRAVKKTSTFRLALSFYVFV
jgi:hypothetical protein